MTFQGPRTDRWGRAALVGAATFLTLVSAAALWQCYRRGSILYYGDAEAHLNIARRILDSRTPGLRQVGTVWLPVPHLAMLPFVQSDWLWETGLAGAIPSSIAFIAAGLFLFASARRLFGSVGAAVAVLLAFVANPNLLYLQSTPMTQPLFFAASVGLLYFAVRFRESQGRGWLVAAGVAASLAALTRYEGWFMIPVATAFFAAVARERRWSAAAAFGALASVGPAVWLFHNLWFWGDPLEFYRGPYSAMASYVRSLASGAAPYRGDHDWHQAWLYYRTAAEDCLGWPLVILGIAGIAAAVRSGRGWPILLLAAAPIFYVWTVHSGGIPIFVPDLWPNSLYNTRYGLAALPLFALAVGALVAAAPARWRTPTVALVALAVASPWLGRGLDSSICWREAQATSEARRKATDEAAAFLRTHYRRGDGIVMSFGDLTGILREAGIPLKETLIQDNVLDWQRVVSAPATQLQESWAVTSSGDPVAGILATLGKSGPSYQCLQTVTEQGGPTVQICRRG